MITWNEVTSCTDDGERWEASFPSDTHMIDIWPHEKEGFSWCVITEDVEDNAPEGWSPTVEDAKRHAAQAYEEWVKEHDETAEIVADAVAQERAAVVAFLRACEDESCVFADDIVFTFAAEIERGDHRRGEGA